MSDQRFIQSIIPAISYLSVGKIIQLSCKFILSMVIARVLGPSQFGFWSIIELINKYSPLLTLGISSGVKRELPYWSGKNNIINLELTEKSGLIGMLFSVTVFSIFSIFSFFVISNELAKYAVMATFLAGGFGQLYLYFNSTLLAKKKFRASAILISIEGLMILFLTVTLVYKFGFYGLLIGNILVPLGICIYFINRYQLFRKLKFNYEIFRRIISVGIPLILVGMGSVFLLTVNRLIIPLYMNLENVGYFSFAMLFLTLFVPLIGSFGEILYTYMNEHIGKHEKVDNMDHIAIYPSLMITLFIPCIIIPVMLGIPWGITKYFPQFLNSITSSQLVLILVVINVSGVNILSSYMKQKWMLVFLIISIIINIILCNIFLGKGFGVEGAIVALIIGSIFYKASNTLASLIFMKKTQKTYLLVVMTFIYSIGLSFLTYYYFDIAMSYVMITISIPFIIPCTIMLLVKKKFIV